MEKSTSNVELSKEEIDKLMKDLPNIIRQIMSDDDREHVYRGSEENIERKEK